MSRDNDPELDQYLRGDSEVSAAYRDLESAPPPGQDVDARVLRMSRQAAANSAPLTGARTVLARRPTWFAPFALAATVVLSVALVLAVILEPAKQRRVDDSAHWVYAAAHKSDRLPLRTEAPATPGPRAESNAPRDAQSWLTRIRELRHEGRFLEADAEFRRFRAAFPDTVIPAEDEMAP
jgi:hypothetical protein